MKSLLTPLIRVALVTLLAAAVTVPSAWSATEARFAAIDTTRLAADSVWLDRAYIPALALTSENQVAPSTRAMGVLRAEWTRFRATWDAAAPADAQWRPDLEAVGQRIDAAAAIVATGHDLVRAHEELEHVRLILRVLRGRHGVTHFTDGLTRFHEDMEAVVLAAKGKTADTLAPADLRQIRTHLPGALAAWNAILAQPVDGELLGFDTRRLAALRAGLAAEQAALTTLERRLQGDSLAAVIESAVAIKPPFAKIFKLFGDFERVL